MHYYKVLLVGGPGKGKTYSFRRLAEEGQRACYLNIENKPLPFKGKFALEKVPKTPAEVRQFMQLASVSDKFDVVLVDSFSAYAEMLLAEARATKKGYDIWNHYNEHIGTFMEVMKNVQKEVFVVAHYEIIGDEISGQKERRAKSKGKEWEGMIEKEFTIVLYTEAIPIPGTKPERFFSLVTDGTNTAKVPPEIFGEDTLKVENDSRLVLEKIRAFKGA